MYSDYDFKMMQFIQNQRIYDVLVSLYAEVAGDEKAEELMLRHTEGKLFAPPPAIFVPKGEASDVMQKLADDAE